jgi:poly-gamma-glutamate synthesis protein (capsule biosynthesis protein)
MKKFWVCISIALALTLSSCSFFGVESENITSNLEQVFTLTEPEVFTDFLEVKPKERDFFENAFAKAPTNREMRSNVGGILLSINSNLLDSIASIFTALGSNRDKEVTVILLTANKSEKSDKVIASELPYKTPYGFLKSDENLLAQIKKLGFLTYDDEVLKKESSAAFLAAFVRKVFPNARMVALLVDDEISTEQSSALTDFLANLNQENHLIVADSAFSNHSNADLAKYQTRFARTQISEGNYENLNNLNAENLAVLRIFLATMELRGFPKAIFQDKGFVDGRGFLTAYFLKGERLALPEVFVTAVGDVMLDRYVRTLMEKFGESYPFDLLNENDFLRTGHVIHANLEGPTTENDRISAGDVIFKFDPWMIDLLLNQGISLISLANNHTLDQGKSGFEESKKILTEKGMNWFGHPLNELDNHIFSTRINGLRMAFIGLHDATVDLDLREFLEKIPDLKKSHDLVIVSIHWGIEYKRKSSNRQQQLAYQMIDAGVDAVIGHHPHVRQEIEWYKSRPIIYSLGNFIFDQYWSTETQKGSVVGLIFSPKEIELYTWDIESIKSQVKIAE